MNLNEAYKIFQKEGYKELNNAIYNENKENEKNEYFFSILNLLNKLDEALKSGKLNNVMYVRFRHKFDYDGGDVISNVAIYDDKKNEMLKFSGNKFSLEYEIIRNIFGNGTFSLNDKYYSQEMEGGDFLINLKDSPIEKLKKILLNDELIKILNFFEMEEKIPELKNEISNKSKI